MAGAGLLFCNVGPETKALGFSLSNSRLYGPEGRMTNWWSIIKGSGSAAAAKGCLNT